MSRLRQTLDESNYVINALAVSSVTWKAALLSGAATTLDLSAQSVNNGMLASAFRGGSFILSPNPIGADPATLTLLPFETEIDSTRYIDMADKNIWKTLYILCKSAGVLQLELYGK